VSRHDFSCDCLNNWNGTVCDNDIDWCLGNNCSGNGTCVELPENRSYACACDAGFSGDLCEFNFDACASSPCEHGATCVESDHGIGYECNCSAGWRETETRCHYVDDCFFEPCLNRGNCSNNNGPTEGSALQAHYDNVFMTPTCSGSLVSCDSGSLLEGRGLVGPARDLNREAHYPNTLFSGCADGNHGIYMEDESIERIQISSVDGLPMRADELVLVTVTAVCYESQDSVVVRLGQSFDFVASWNCSVAGVSTFEHVFRLSLVEGLDVVRAQIVEAGASSGACAVGDYSDNDDLVFETMPNHGFVCSCAAGFDGVNCSHNIQECDSNPCQNGGLCVDYIAAFACTCPWGYAGDLCEIAVVDCASNPCMNGATCVENVPGEFNCSCADGFRGVLCSLYDDCASFPCMNGGNCSNNLGESESTNYSSKNASFNAGLGAPYCGRLTDVCDSSSTLVGHGGMLGMDEVNAPNTIDGCNDSVFGDFHVD